MIEFTLDGGPIALEVDKGTPLLWVLREQVGLTGTKFGCTRCTPRSTAVSS